MTAKHRGMKSRTTSENPQTADAHGTAEITRQSLEKSGDSNSTGLEPSDITMSAKTCGTAAAAITGQSLEKSNDNSPGLEQSNSSITAKHQGKKKSRMIKTTRRKTSENPQTADAHGTAEISGQSLEKTGDSNSSGLELSDITSQCLLKHVRPLQ